jgi:glycogen operon protein
MELGDVDWFTPSGDHMTAEDWDAGCAKSVLVFLNGDAITEPGPHGEQVTDDSFLLLFNAHSESIDFVLCPRQYGDAWEFVLDTFDPDVADRPAQRTGEKLTLPARSLLVLRRA